MIMELFFIQHKETHEDFGKKIILLRLLPILSSVLKRGYIGIQSLYMGWAWRAANLGDRGNNKAFLWHLDI